MIPFNNPPFLGTEIQYISEALNNHKICGDGPFTLKCRDWMQKNFHVNHVLLTTSCTHSLEMAAILSDIQPGDEVILPSYTFVSTADAFVQRGAKLVFVDIRPDTLNIDESLIEDAITEKTKAIVPVHYAGVSCEMDKILSLAKKYNLKVIEDAAQGFGSTYKGKFLGTIGDFGCYSFHETKNLSMGEGGALLFQNDDDLENAEILREKGTNRSKFFRGQIDKYTWVGYGSSYLPSDLNAAHLWAQILDVDKLQKDRMSSYEYYDEKLKFLSNQGAFEQPYVPDYVTHNAHMYYIKLANLEQRSALIKFLGEHNVMGVFHYIPLHSSPAGKKYGYFHGEDRYTTKESERILRLPMYYGLTLEDKDYIIQCISEFFS